MKTLRARLFASIALAVLVSSALTVLVGGLLTRRYLEQGVERNLERQVEAAAAAIAGGVPEATTKVVAFFRGQGALLLLPDAALGQGAGIRAAVLATGEQTGKIELFGRSYLFAVADTSSGEVVLARPANLDPGDATSTFLILLLSGAGGAGVAAIVAYAVARRASRPLQAVADASRRLASGEANVRVPVQGVDELAELGASFNQMAEQLAAARDAERTFLLSVSHELKTPLTAIRGYAEALADGASAPQEAGPVIGREAERLDRLVGDLLDLARLDQRRFTVANDAVDLRDVADEIERRYAPRAAEFGLGFEVETAGDASATGDRDRLIQVVSNLVENALRSTPTGGQIIVRARAGEIRVQDTGPGLAPDDLPRAFDRFFLYERYRGERPVGSGLGLAIVRELVEAMDGSVAVQSEPGIGTTFTVRLAAS